MERYWRGIRYTIAGLLNHIAGHVPSPGEHLDYGGLRFENPGSQPAKSPASPRRRLTAAAMVT